MLGIVTSGLPSPEGVEAREAKLFAQEVVPEDEEFLSPTEQTMYRAVTVAARINFLAQDRAELAKTRAALDLMGKAHALLETLSESADKPPRSPR